MIQQIGEPVSSEGEFPVAVTINKKGDQVCVLNAGQVNGVQYVFAAWSLSSPLIYG